jgi:hypothetical protein
LDKIVISAEPVIWAIFPSPNADYIALREMDAEACRAGLNFAGFVQSPQA